MRPHQADGFRPFRENTRRVLSLHSVRRHGRPTTRPFSGLQPCPGRRLCPAASGRTPRHPGPLAGPGPFLMAALLTLGAIAWSIAAEQRPLPSDPRSRHRCPETRLGTRTTKQKSRTLPQVRRHPGLRRGPVRPLRQAHALRKARRPAGCSA